MPAAETLRAREVYRYYQPRDLTESAETNGHIPTDSSNDTFHKKTNFTTQQSFSDTALTAFAQLIALRLVSQRAIVSLIDHENEYFLAESTSTLSLIDENGPAQNAWLSISGARVPREASLCEQTLRLVPNQDTTAEMTPVCLVPDLRLDEKMSHLDCVRGPPYLRFYCGVALTNKKGVNIGCVYVVDDRPRTDFSLEQTQFLTSMAATVMDHLENIRAKEDIVRVTMMSQALHAFIEGDGTMYGDWQRLKKYKLPAGAGIGYHWESNRDDGSGAYANGKKELGATSSTTRNLPLSDFLDVTSGTGQSPLQHSEGVHDARFNFNNSPWSSTSEVTQVLPLKSVYEGIDEASEPLTGGRDTEFSNSGFSNLLHATFSRASNLVREGMEVDGAVYFDAPFRFYQGRSTLESETRKPEQQDTDSLSEGESDEYLTTRPGPRPHVSPTKYLRSENINHTNMSPTSKDGLGLKSDVLGYSTGASSSWNNQIMDPHTSFAAIDQSLLTSLVRRYPQGELFVFDKEGPIAPAPETIASEGSEVTITSAVLHAKRARQKARKRADILRLLVAFPGARQIFFVPLYDSTSGCFIGSFAWSTSATRIFSIENHLSYLIAFGHSVMSEVSRLNTLSADHAKGDFISNVSHELRSPLHGILASVEFLADTALDGFQRNLVDTVDICGRTLLDTIEHVLDFSKIKKFGTETMQPMGSVSDLDVSAVIEEVLEGVYAGFEYNGLSSQGLADTTKSRTRDASVHLRNISTSTSEDLQIGVSNDLLTVILDIDFRDQWKFPTVPGTWRRLTMNLFGNALKYTRVGYIKIRLEARSIVPGSSNFKNDGIERTMVTLTITDSGKGMSPEFMKTKLFMPFSQEDVTAPGTGLGMSIVKQIVDLSGGRIDIRTEVGKGTEVKLSLPLEDCPRKSDDSLGKKNSPYEDEGPIDAVRRRAKGRTVTIRGFDSVFRGSDIRTAATKSLKASIVKCVTEWFDLTVVSDDQIADIVISDESAFLSASIDPGSEFRSQLILCSNGAKRDIYTSRLEAGQTVEFVSKPCGPHRLAKALLNCFDTEDALKRAGIEQRVSSNLQEPYDEAFSTTIPTSDAILTAGTSSNRLIGDLQSSIGFSPTAANLKRIPGSQANSEDGLQINKRPPFTHRSSTGNTSQLKSVDSVSSNSITTSNETSEESSNYDTPESSTDFLGHESPNLELQSEDSACVPETPKMLLVEDNPVNMMLLATYMKKNDWQYETANNGLEALQAFSSRPGGFDVIFMDVSMPIMNGYEATREIRDLEAKRRAAYREQERSREQSPLVSPSATILSTSFPFNSPMINKNFILSNTIDLHLLTPELKLNRPALIIALTGFSSQQDQESAFASGVDVFMTKPVRFREVGRILEGWMRSRERESREGLLGVSKAVPLMERREVDEIVSGAKRSG